MTVKMKTYGAARLALAPVERLAERDQGGQPQARCPCCGRFAKVFTLIDLRGWPETAREALAAGKQWACDGCWTGWARKRLACGDGRIFSEAILQEFSAMAEG